MSCGLGFTEDPSERGSKTSQMLLPLKSGATTQLLMPLRDTLLSQWFLSAPVSRWDAFAIGSSISPCT